MRSHSPITTSVLTVLVSICALSTLFALEEKIDSKDFLERHLGAIGSAEARKEWKSTFLAGHAELKMLVGGSGTLQGSGALLSSGPYLGWSVDFEHPEYQGESISFDGKNVNVGDSGTTVKSPLGWLIYTHPEIVREGLLGGASTTAWALTDLKKNKAKLRCEGLQDLDGEQLQACRYESRGSSDLKVALYFEPGTFRHVATTYKYRAPAFMDNSPRVTQHNEVHYELTEKFGNHFEREGLTLPSIWSIRYSASGNLNLLWEWTLSFTQIAINPQPASDGP